MEKRKVEVIIDGNLVETEFKFLKESDIFRLDNCNELIYTAIEDPKLSEEGIWGIIANLSKEDINKIKTSIVD